MPYPEVKLVGTSGHLSPPQLAEADMGKLKAMPMRLGALPAKVRQAPKVAEPFYLSKAWLDAKAAKRREGNVWCVDCGSTKRLILDHDWERKDGGADLDLRNLKWRCAPCHNRKTAASRARRASRSVG